MPQKGDSFTQGSSESWLSRRIASELKDLSSVQLWQAVLSEFFGTMCLCIWTIGVGLHAEDDDPPPLLAIALGSGLAVGAIIATLLHVSGGHVNPAVSVGFLIRGKTSCVRFVCFALAQLASSVVAVFVIQATFPEHMHGGLGFISAGFGVAGSRVLAAEFLVGFLLVFGITGLTDDARSDTEGLVPMYVAFIVASNIVFAPKEEFQQMNTIEESKLFGKYWDTPPSTSLSSSEHHDDDDENDADNESDTPSPPPPINIQHEYNGDSGYEAESKPDEEEDETLMNDSFQGSGAGSYHGDVTTTTAQTPDTPKTFNVYSEGSSSPPSPVSKSSNVSSGRTPSDGFSSGRDSPSMSHNNKIPEYGYGDTVIARYTAGLGGEREAEYYSESCRPYLVVEAAGSNRCGEWWPLLAASAQQTLLKITRNSGKKKKLLTQIAISAGPTLKQCCYKIFL